MRERRARTRAWKQRCVSSPADQACLLWRVIREGAHQTMQRLWDDPIRRPDTALVSELGRGDEAVDVF